MLQCTDGTICEAMTLQEAKSIARHLGVTLRTKHKKALTRVASPSRRAEGTNNRNQSGGSEMELRETTIDRLRKRLGRDPTEEEIKAERDRKWRFALADMGITAECSLDVK